MKDEGGKDEGVKGKAESECISLPFPSPLRPFSPSPLLYALAVSLAWIRAERAVR